MYNNPNQPQQPPFEQPSYGQPPNGQPSYGQPPWREQPLPYGQPQPPNGQPSYGQPPWREQPLQDGQPPKKRSRWLLVLAIIVGLLVFACVGVFAASFLVVDDSPANPAGTDTQDPPIPKLTQDTHGILDTTGTVSQSYITQLRNRSDQVETDGYQIAVIFFNNLSSDPHQFATDVFNQNKIGFGDKDNGVLFVFYLQKAGKDGHAPWISYITGTGISGALPDGMMGDFADKDFVPQRATGNWQQGLLAFYDDVHNAELNPNVALEWATQHPQATNSQSSSSSSDRSGILWLLILIGIAITLWLGSSAVIAARRRANFFSVARHILFVVLGLLRSALSSGSSSSGNSSGGGGSSSGGGSWGGGGSSSGGGGDR